MVVLHIEVDAVTSRCAWEAPAHVAHRDVGDGGSESQQVTAFAPSFPHIYGPIDRDAVRAVQRVLRDSSGRFTGYGELGPSI